jgi:uncharacterized protein DUF664
MTWTAPAFPRVDEPFAGTERATLEGLLDWYRASFLLRCAGLTAGQLCERAVPPSNLSLLGLVRHVADVERNYFRRRYGGQDIPSLYYRPDRPDACFEETDAADAARDLERLVAEQHEARQAVAGLPLETTYANPRFGDMSLRWAYAHLIAEYAGHCGHADLLRERIDGTTFG